VASTDWIVPGSTIYLDANIVVYFIERRDALQQGVIDILQAAVAAECRFVANEMVAAECLFGVFRSRRNWLIGAYETFFTESPLLMLTPIDGKLLLRAALVGATAGFALIDATHVVSAQDAGAAHLLTNDRRLRSHEGIKVVQLADL